MKNIVICLDGTGNQLGETYSNVVKIYSCLTKDPLKQMVYYDPGVGTMSDPNVVTPWSKMISKVGGMAFGWGLKRNVTEAYSYLMEYYEPGDRIYIYGFSRGAYSARVLAAMIHTVGLLEKGCQHLIPYAWEAFKNSVDEKVKKTAQQFKDTYSRTAEVYFLGLWDTVTSFGIFNRIKLPFTTHNPSVRNARHAIAIDERRAYYRQNLLGKVQGQNVKQVWFSGVHSDVGGSYAMNESGLSQIALEWMIGESLAFNVGVDIGKARTILYHTPGHSIPDEKETVHRSLSMFWMFLEILPRRRRRWPMVYFPMGRRRKMHFDFFGRDAELTIHESVMQKISSGQYSPKNFDRSKPFNIEPWVKI